MNLNTQRRFHERGKPDVPPLQGSIRVEHRVPRALPWAGMPWPFRPEECRDFTLVSKKPKLALRVDTKPLRWHRCSNSPALKSPSSYRSSVLSVPSVVDKGHQPTPSPETAEQTAIITTARRWSLNPSNHSCEFVSIRGSLPNSLRSLRSMRLNPSSNFSSCSSRPSWCIPLFPSSIVREGDTP